MALGEFTRQSPGCLIELYQQLRRTCAAPEIITMVEAPEVEREGLP